MIPTKNTPQNIERYYPNEPECPVGRLLSQKLYVITKYFNNLQN